MRDNYFCKDNIDRSQWTEKLLSQNPEIKEFREQVLPVDRAINFGSLYLPEERIINQGVIFSIISQHLHTLGLLSSEQALQNEWVENIDFPISLNQSQLCFLIQRGIQNIENLWLLTTPGTMSNADTEEILTKKVVEEFEKIIGKEIHLNHNFIDNSPILSEKSDDLLEFELDQEDHLYKATINQLIFICTADIKYNSKQLLSAFCLLSLSLVKNCNIIFSKIHQRFEVVTSNLNPESNNKSQIAVSEEESSETDTNSEQKKSGLSSQHNLELNDETISQVQLSQIDSSISYSNFQFKQVKMILQLLSIWIRQVGLQISPPVISSILSFLRTKIPIEYNKKVKKIIFQIERLIQFRYNQFSEPIENEADHTTSITPPPKVELDSHHMPWSLDFELTMLPTIELARQITMFMSHHFYQIKGCELVYSKETEIEQNQPNLNALITKSNNFFRWLQFKVLSKSEINERASSMSYFVRVAQKLYKMQNFYGCSLILNAFDNSFAFLKATKSLVSKSDLNFIEETKNQLVNFDADSSVFQQFFRESLSRGPVIPVLYPYKSSIQSAIKGRLVENDKVNVPVLIEIHKLVGEFEDFQKKKFNFYLIDQAQELLEKCSPPKSLNELIDYAKQLE